MGRHQNGSDSHFQCLGIGRAAIDHPLRQIGERFNLARSWHPPEGAAHQRRERIASRIADRATAFGHHKPQADARGSASARCGHIGVERSFQFEDSDRHRRCRTGCR